jgi:magnesium transporter
VHVPRDEGPGVGGGFNVLVNCVAYQDGRKLGPIEPREIHNYVNRPGCFVWVAMFEPDAPELEAMREEFDLHELAIEDASKGDQRPKVEEYGESLVAVMHVPEITDTEIRFGQVIVFVGPNFVLSVRQHTQQGFAGVRSRSEREPELMRFGPGYVFYAILDNVVDRYFPVLERIESELESIEERIFSAHNNRAIIESLYTLKQKIVALKHATGPLLEATGKLYGGRVPQQCTSLGEYFRDVYDHLVRINQSIDSLRDMVTTAISVNLSLLTIQENEVTKRLAGYAALVAVPTMVAGVYGMNFVHMPEIDWRFGYPLAIALMVGIDVYLFWRFRKAKWL